MNITEHQLVHTFKKYRQKLKGTREQFFTPLFISKKHEQTIDTVLRNFMVEDRQTGIDGFYLDKEARNLYLYKAVWGDDLREIKEACRQLTDHGMQMIFGDPHGETPVNGSVGRLKYALEEYRDIINKVYIRFVFNGNLDLVQQNHALQVLRENLESKKYLIDQYFGTNSIQFIIEYLSNRDSATFQASKTTRTHKYSFPFKVNEHIEAPDGEQLYLGVVSLLDMRNMFREMRQRLFEKNIRSSLDENRAPNRAIKKTLKEILVDQTLAPEYFSFHNNGVTLYVEHFDVEDGVMTVIEPRVLNGAQTITTFSRFLDSLNETAGQAKTEKLAGRIKVLAKIISNCSSDFVTNVTIANNRQNPVDAINLRATDEIQFEFEDKFRNELGIYYERQEKAFENLSEDELEQMGIYESKEIGIKKLAQTFLALQGEVDRISRLNEVFENDHLYKSTFREDYLKVDAHLILLLYKAHLRINLVIRDIMEKGHQKYWWANKAKNLVWALLVQAILNEEEMEELIEQYGESLTVTTEFGEYLKGLGSKRIRFILSELVEQEKYAGYMEKEQYGFFRSKVAYQEAMQIAREKFGWSRKGI